MANRSDRDRSIEHLLRQAPIGSLSGEWQSPDCVDAERLAAWTARTLRSDESARVETHVADCARCQAMLAVFAESEPVAVPAAVPFWRHWSVRWLAPVWAASIVVLVWAVAVREPADPAPMTMARVEQFDAPPVGLDQVAPLPQAPPSPSSAAPPAPSAMEQSFDTRAIGREQARSAEAASAPSAAAAAPQPSGQQAMRPEPPPLMPPASASLADDEPAPVQGFAPGPPPPAPAAPPPPPSASPVASSERSGGAVAAAPSPPPAPAAAPPAPEAARVVQQADGSAGTADANVSITAQSGERAFSVQSSRQGNIMLDGISSADVARPAHARGNATASVEFAAPPVQTGRGTVSVSQGRQAAAMPPPPPMRWRVDPNGRAQRSFDLGRSWVDVELGASVFVTAGSSPIEGVCWLADRGGAVFRSVDGGATFTRTAFAENVSLVAVQAVDASQAMVVAADGLSFTTVDGGTTWREVPQ